MYDINVEIPDIVWYLEKSKTKGLLPRCPFALVESCPRYYQSLSLLGNAGSTKIPKKYDNRLLKKWKKSKLWPVTDEQATSISWSREEKRQFANFCPEVSFGRFGLFASFLAPYPDEIDENFAHVELSKISANKNDWRWYWANISPMHYSACPLYSPLFALNKKSDDKQQEILEIKPSLHGISINIKALWHRIITIFEKRE